MGLLDVFNTEEGRLGLGLLAAAAPRSDGANFGQRLSEGVGSVDAWKKQSLERDLLKAQAAENLAQIEARKQAAIRDKQLQDLIESRFGGGSSSALQQGAAVGDIGPTVTNAARMNQGMGSMTLDDIALLKLRGKDLTDVYKLGQPSWVNVNGNMVNTNTPSFKGGFIPGMQISSNGQASLTTVGPDGLPRISSPPGALDTYAGYQDAEKKAAARYDVTSYTPAGSTNPIQSTRLQDVQRVTGQAKPMPTSGAKPSGYAGGNKDAANAESIKMMQSELTKNYDEPTKEGIRREIARLQGVPVDNRLQSSAEKITSDERAKAAVEAETANTKKGNEYSDFKNQLKYAEKLLNAGPTASWFGNKADQAFGLFGGSSTSANLAKELETTSGWLVQNIPKAPGAQSNFELEQYKIQVGDVGNANIPIPQRLASLKAAQKQIEIWENRVKKGEKVDPDYMPPGAKDAPKESLSTLPKASDHKGKKIRDTATGEILVSNGLSWVKAK